MRTTSTVFNADTARVWRWLTTPELMSRWIHSIENLSSEDGGSLKNGSTLRFTARRREHTSTVISFREGQEFVLRSTQGPVTADYTYRLENLGSGCRVSLSIDCRIAGWMRIFQPLLGFAAWHTDKGQIEHLKTLVESSPADPPPGD